jgi:hypothetical protein
MRPHTCVQSARGVRPVIPWLGILGLLLAASLAWTAAVVHHRDDTPFDRDDTVVDRDEAEARLEARVDRLEAAVERIEVRLDRLERTVRWWIMVQMVSSAAWMALMVSLTRGSREG